MLLEPDKYKTRCIKNVYEPIFQDFKDLGDEKRYPVYANIMQDCLLKESGITWSEFRDGNIKNVKCKSYEPVPIGSLPVKDPKTEIGEKVALLKLMNMGGLANDILDLAKKDTKQAVYMCFTANDLYTAPIFYTRKTLKTVASSFDLQIYQTAIQRLIEFKKETITQKIKKDICYLVNGFNNIGSLDPIKWQFQFQKPKRLVKNLPIL